jgi:hypothetical protein
LLFIIISFGQRELVRLIAIRIRINPKSFN